MKKSGRRLTSVILSFVMMCSIATFAVYADPDDTQMSDNPPFDDGNSTVIVDDPEPLPPSYDPEPDIPPSSVVDDSPSYIDNTPDIPDNPADNNSDNGNDNPIDYDNPENPQGNDIEIPQENNIPDATINYDADYYSNMYGGNVISYNMNTDFNDDYQSAIIDDYNPGMTFEEFEKATDYQSATVSSNNTVDMYKSNGSIMTQNLSKKDWKDISLSFDKNTSNGTGDFSFIKNSDSKTDSNLSVLFLIFGILFILLSLSIVLYMTICVIKRGKRTVTSDKDDTVDISAIE